MTDVMTAAELADTPSYKFHQICCRQVLMFVAQAQAEHMRSVRYSREEPGCLHRSHPVCRSFQLLQFGLPHQHHSQTVQSVMLKPMHKDGRCYAVACIIAHGKSLLPEACRQAIARVWHGKCVFDYHACFGLLIVQSCHSCQLGFVLIPVRSPALCREEQHMPGCLTVPRLWLSLWLSLL